MKPPENEGLKPYFVDVFPFPNRGKFFFKKKLSDLRFLVGSSSLFQPTEGLS